jgi:hypothetical protein
MSHWPKRDGLHASLGLLLRIEAGAHDLDAEALAAERVDAASARIVGEIGAQASLRADPVGMQTAAACWKPWPATAPAHASRYALPDWRRWLFLQLEQATFPMPASPARFV